MYLLQASVTSLALKSLTDIVKGFKIQLPYLIIGVIVFLIFILIARLSKRIIRQLGEKTNLDITLALMLGRLMAAAIILLGILVSAVIVFPTFKPVDLLAGLGFTSVAIGFAFKDILQNFFAGILILWRKPFRIGDEICSGNYIGTVVELNVRSTHIKTYDGTVAVIPNGEIYSNPIQVLTARDSRRLTVTVGIGYENSMEDARARIHQILRDNPAVLAQPEPWVYADDLAPSSVNFNIYFWTAPQQANVLRVKDEVITAIKQNFDEAKIDLPYPHEVILFKNPPVQLSLNDNRKALDYRKEETATGENSTESG